MTDLPMSASLQQIQFETSPESMQSPQQPRLSNSTGFYENVLHPENIGKLYCSGIVQYTSTLESHESQCDDNILKN